jgi:hypothetical protein
LAAQIQSVREAYLKEMLVQAIAALKKANDLLEAQLPAPRRPRLEIVREDDDA